MKKLLSFTVIILLGFVLGTLAANPGEKYMGAPAHSKEFEKMKELAGVWEGTTDMGKGMVTIKATYELTSGGSAVLERLFVGSPEEMVTVYHDFNGKLNMTHYCMLGNQPHMKLKNSSEGYMEFVLSDKNPGLSSLKETHMHGLKISFDDKDSITHTWVLYEKGKKKADTVIKLSRVK